MARMLRIAIIGDPNRRAKDQPLIDEAEKQCKALYAPITQLRLDLTANKRPSVRYNNKNLSRFDYVLIIPTITYKEMFYTVARMLGDKAKPFTHKQYLLVLNEDILFKYLHRRGIHTRKSVFICASSSLPLKNIKFPVIVRVGAKRVMVTNEQTLKDVIAFAERGKPIEIETPIKAKKIVWTFVVGDEVVAGYEKVKRTVKSTNVDDEVKKAGTTVSAALKCDYCALKFIIDQNDECILDKVTFCPDFSNFQRITSKNIARYVISYLKSKAEELWWPIGLLEAVKKISTKPEEKVKG